MGETALKLARHAELLDLEHTVKLDQETLVLPLVRQPTVEEIAKLATALGEIVPSQETFEPKTRITKSLEELLEEKLPPSLLASLPNSFDIVGDIAIVEFPHELSDHENLVADALMEANHALKAVFAKAGPVAGPERVRTLRHLAGEDRTTTIHREFGCRFMVDLSKVYFSPRLSNEHNRVAEQVQAGECVVDMFAGVGPFTILIAKRLKDAEVNAVDANPEAVKLIRENIRLNKPKATIKVWEGDARNVVEEFEGRASRVIMNLPSAAKDYVATACRALRSKGGILHYYTFSEGLDYSDRAITELEQALASAGWRLTEKIGTRAVRGVAPMQWQVVVDAKVHPDSVSAR